jgi:5-hydroxyisourate hydrolase
VSTVSTHFLDTATGRPAAGVQVDLEAAAGDGWERVGGGVTDGDGRVADLAAGGTLGPGTYRLAFATGAWFAAAGTAGFYPRVTVEFLVEDPGGHYHVPLLLSPYGYSTYRGS